MSARVMLAEVLAALTWDGDPRFAEFWRVSTRPYPDGSRLTNRVVVDEKGVGTFNVVEGLTPLRAVAHQPWRHDTPAAALEALVAAGLLADHWTDAARAPRWWCGWCGGSGIRWHDADACASSCFCLGGVTDAPPSLPALVSVAALGPDALARAEAIVAETWPGRALVWRVMTRAEIEEHHNRTDIAADAHDPATAFSREVAAEMYLGGRPAHVAAPWEAPLGNDATSVVLAWDALYALARHEDGTATGVHLVGLDAGAVMLAVEGVP